MFKNFLNSSSINCSGSINVNGQKYTGSSISIIGNKVFVDGKDQTPDVLSAIILGVVFSALLFLHLVLNKLGVYHSCF